MLCEGLLYGFGLWFVNYLYMWVYFISGIPFDLAHAGSNPVIALVLFKPLNALFETVNRKLERFAE